MAYTSNCKSEAESSVELCLSADATHRPLRCLQHHREAPGESHQVPQLQGQLLLTLGRVRLFRDNSQCSITLISA